MLIAGFIFYLRLLAEKCYSMNSSKKPRAMQNVPARTILTAT